jgi:hypothetical protein
VVAKDLILDRVLHHLLCMALRVSIRYVELPGKIPISVATLDPEPLKNSCNDFRCVQFKI